MSSEASKITLRSSDGELFDVPEAVARECETIKHMIEDNCADNIIHVPNVVGNVLAKVIEYCKTHVEASSSSSSSNVDLEAFEAEFIKVDNDTLYDLILAANYLNVKKLLELTCKTVADRIKDKTPEEICELFNIVNDFTPEEEENLRTENAWAYE